MSSEQQTVTVNNLRHVDGRPIDMVAHVLGNNSSVVGFCGAPGIGKTTILRQLGEQLRDAGVETYEVFYDEAKTRTLRSLNENLPTRKRFRSSAELNKAGKNFLDANLIQDVQAVEQKVARNRGDVILVEFPLIGGLGWGTVEYLAWKYRGKLDLVKIGTDINLQQFAGYIRWVVGSKMSPEARGLAKNEGRPDPALEIEPFLEARNIFIAGSMLEDKPPLDRCLLVGELFGNSAPMSVIRTLRIVEGKEAGKIPGLAEARTAYLRLLTNSRVWGCSYATIDEASKDARLLTSVDSVIAFQRRTDALWRRFGIPDENRLVTVNLLRPHSLDPYISADPIFLVLNK